MKLLKVAIGGDDLYRDSLFSIDLYATDRVLSAKDGHPLSNVTKIKGSRNLYSENVIGMSGVNAAGKSTSINLLEFASFFLTMPYLKRSDRFTWEAAPAKLKQEFTFSAIFWHDGRLYLIDSTLARSSDKEERFAYRILDERLFVLNASSASKASLSSFERFRNSADLLIHRNAEAGQPGALSEDQKTFLREDMSIAAAVTGNKIRRGRTAHARLEEQTYSTELVDAFDSSVEYLDWDSEGEVYRLKFFGEPERVVSRRAAESQLSYGTLIGSELVLRAIGVLREGGLMIVDEIERGLNKSLVRTVIELFLSAKTNPQGAQLIFTTHYPEILDYLPRKDDVYLLVRDAEHKTEVIKYSDRVKRIENKKSEVVLSNYVKGTVPSYPDIKNLRTFVARSVNRNADE